MRELYDRVVELLRGHAPTGDATRIEKRIAELAERAAESDRDEAEVQSLLDSWIVQFPQRSAGWLGTDAAIADLDSLLTGPNNRREKVWNRLRRLAGWCFDHYVAVAGLVTVLATLFYGFAYSLFFRTLDITTEQAGLTPPLLLTRSALGGLILTLLFALGAFALAVPYIPIRDDKAAREEFGSMGATLLNACLTVLASIYLAFVLFLAGLSTSVPILFFAALPIVPLLLVSFRLRGPRSRFPLKLRPLEFDPDKYLTFFVAAALPIGLFMAAFITIVNAEFYGEKAHDGYAVRNPSIFGLPFFGARAEPALVEWREGDPAGPHIPRCLLDVGSSGGGYYLYDHRTGRTFEVQSDAVTIELRDRAETCDAPLNRSPPTIQVLKRENLKCNPGAWYTYFPPIYDYQWISGGVGLENHSPSARMFVGGLDRDGLRCRVIARNPFGEEIALSHQLDAHAVRHYGKDPSD